MEKNLNPRIISIRALSALALFFCIGTASAQTFEVATSGDWGNSHHAYPSSNAVDKNTSFSSRWASNFSGGSANLWVDFGTVQRIDDVGIAWGRGNQRSYVFEVWARKGTSGSWTKVFDDKSSGDTTGVEQYNVDDFSARQVRVKVFSNSAGTVWADITEFEVYGTSGPGSTSSNSITTVNVPKPTNSTPVVNVPGLIQAEEFTDYKDVDSRNNGGAYRNTGVDLESCSDANCGYNVGWTKTGEWLDYNINVLESGSYEAKIRVAANNSNGRYSFSLDGSKVTSTKSVANTGGWQRWVTKTVSLGTISQGKHTLRLYVENSGFNVNWISMVRTGEQIAETNDFNLNSNSDPWDNFDLSRWSLDTPAPRNDDQCKAERTWDYSWSTNNPLDSSSAPFFFTHSDGGMRFVTRIDGESTSSSCNSGYVRSELREMIRAGNRDIDDTGVSRNNWKLGYQPGADSNWGGVNGRMDATLRVNKVTTTGSSGQVGRVIIGQIHAINDEPLRLYYRKRSGQSKGCIYFAHEIRNDDDINFSMIGDESCTSSPSNGIALDELFSYSIINNDEDLTVIIRRGDRNGSVIAQKTIDMNQLNSGYDRSDEAMYFKAGAYTQNDSGNGSDGDIVTFYRLSVSHD